MANIILRAVNGGVGNTVKGAPLSNAEMDQNLINIDVALTGKIDKTVALASGVDLNTVTTSGIYRLSSVHPNMAPAGALGQMLVMRGGDTISQQIVDFATGRVFVRGGGPIDTVGAVTWVTWKELANTSTLAALTTSVTIAAAASEASAAQALVHKNAAQISADAVLTIPRRELLTASRIYYVRKDGSNSNTGLLNTSTGAFLTIKKAVNAMMALDFGGNPAITGTIRVGDGTYEESLDLYGLTGFSSQKISIIGNILEPNNTVLYATSGTYYGIAAFGKTALWYFTGFHVNATRIPNYGTAIQAVGGSYLGLGIHNLTLWAGINGYGAYESSSRLEPAEYVNITISGACRSLIMADAGAYANLQANILTLNGVVAGTTASAYGQGRVTFYAQTIIGTSVGTKFYVEALGWIQTFGMGLSFIPGTIPGAVEIGGVYT